MSQFAVWAGIAGFVICLCVIAFGLFARRRTEIVLGSETAFKLVGLFCLCWLAVWLWLMVSLPLLAWGLWIGDNQHWFYSASPYLAAAFACAFSGFVVYRILRRSVGKFYKRGIGWGSFVMLTLFAFIWIVELVDPIEGPVLQGLFKDAAPDAAAESALGRMYTVFDEPVRLIADSKGSDQDRCRTFWIMGKDEPRGRITVCRYKTYWWRYSGSEKFPRSDVELARAKEAMNSLANRDRAMSILSDIVAHYPGTPAAQEANELIHHNFTAPNDLPQQ